MQQGDAFAAQRWSSTGGGARQPAEATPVERAREQLERLCTYFQAQLAQLAWPSEEARWGELAVCIAEHCEPDLDAAYAREAVGQLQFLGLLEIATLAPADGDEPRPDDLAAARRILERWGFSARGARRAIDAIAGAAAGFRERCNGRPQLFMHHQGEAIVGELTDLLRGTGLERAELDRAARQWLQNAFNMPIPIVLPAVTQLCERIGAQLDELLEAADEMALNVALVDDLAVLAAIDPGFWTWSESLDAGDGDPAAPGAAGRGG